MRLQVHEQGGVVVVAPEGEINFENTALVGDAIRERLDLERQFLLDLSLVPYLDSTSLGTILDTLRSVRARDGDLRLAGLASNVRRVFDLTHASSLLEIYDSREQGVASFGMAAEQEPAG